MNKIILLLLVFIQTSSCSFHSTQYDYVRGIVFQENIVNNPEKNWMAYWIDMRIDLYAINLEDQIIFADEKINILYKEKQVYKVMGLFPDNSVLDIESIDGSIIYKMNGKRIGIDFCERGQIAKIDDLSERYSQSCASDQSIRDYQNQIISELHELGLV